jgi:hypothetical protein
VIAEQPLQFPWLAPGTTISLASGSWGGYFAPIDHLTICRGIHVPGPLGRGRAIVASVYSTRWIKVSLSMLGLLTIRDTGYASSSMPVLRESTSRTSCAFVRSGSSQASSRSRSRITGMRLWSCATKPSESLVMIVKVWISSPSGLVQTL